MAHAAAHSHHDPVATRKEYIKVFKWLCILTVIEVSVVYLKHLHVPEMIIALLVVIFSSSKAVLVGYYYMHLKSETKWLKMVALLPVIAFGYAFFLGIDYKINPHHASVYLHEPVRKFTSHGGNLEDLPSSQALEKVVEKLPAEATAPRSALGVETPVDSQAAGLAPAREESAATPTKEGEAPPAAGGADEWK